MNPAFLNQSFGLSGRTALVTGSARGIGFAIAGALGRAGARVVINDLDADACARASDALGAEGIEARTACFDVSALAEVQAAERELTADGWEVDVLVSNAGNQNRKPLIDMSDAEWRRLMAVHLDGAFHCTRTFLPAMRARGFGRIVMMSSMSAEATMPGIAAYSTAKAGLCALSRAIAVEHGAAGVTANAIAPGFIRTDFTAALQQREGFDAVIRDSVPAGRWGTTDDIAAVALFLVSPAAAFVNGQTLVVDGGMLARL